MSEVCIQQAAVVAGAFSLAPRSLRCTSILYARFCSSTARISIRTERTCKFLILYLSLIHIYTVFYGRDAPASERGADCGVFRGDLEAFPQVGRYSHCLLYTSLRAVKAAFRLYQSKASQGKQSVRTLLRQNRGVSSVEISKTGIRGLELSLIHIFLPVACNSAFLDFLIGQPLRFYACVH